MGTGALRRRAGCSPLQPIGSRNVVHARVASAVATPFVGGRSHRRTGEHGEKALMTHWKHLVVALVAAFALAACSSSDNGGTASTEDQAPPPAEETPAEQIAELQGEKDREQAKADREAAKALYGALREPLAILTADPEEAVTLPAASSNRDLDDDGSNDDFPFPALGEPENGMYSGENDDDESFTVLIRSTKEDPTTLPFAEAYATGSSRLGAGQNALTSAGTIQPLSTADAKAKSANFPQESGIRTYLDGSRSFRGTYDGAAGVYSCSGTTCTVEFEEDGYVFAGTWTFNPDDNARISVEDTQFISYGWWLKKNSDGEILDAGPVYYRTPSADLATIDALEGTAKYEGEAVGKYAIYSGLFSERSEAGHFTADAELEVDFGDESAPGEISGDIVGFMTEAGPKDDWSVKLETVVLTSTGTFTSDPTTTTAGTIWSIGEIDSDVKGDYSGSLHDSGKAGQDTVPYEVGGTFSARYEEGVGAMVGAFAAKRTTE